MNHARIRSILWVGAVVLCATPARAQQAIVTGVQIEVRDGEISLTLETPESSALRTFPTRSGQTLIVDIPSAQLQLATGEEEFRRSNPSPDVESIAVVPLDGGGIRITAIGTTTAPGIEVQAVSQGLIVNLRSPMTVSEDSSDIPDAGDLREGEEAEPMQTAEPDDPGSEPEPEPLADIDDGEAPVAGEDPDEDALEVIVTATRRQERVQDVPRAVTVITREEIEEQATVADDFSDILPRLVPGLGPPNQLGTTFGQNLRGRPPLILIDGIPQNSNTNFSTEINAIDPSIVERVEVVRGPSATFGDGATGGVINIITRSPTEEERLVSRVTVGTINFPTNFGDSFSFDAQYSLSGCSGPYDFVVDGTFDRDRSRFDAPGNQLPPTVTSDDESINFLGKFGVDLTENQRLQFSYNIFNDNLDATAISDPAAVAPEGLQTAVALELGEIDFDEQPEQTVQNLSLQYRHEDLFKSSQLETVFYFRETNLVQLPTVLPATVAIPPDAANVPSDTFQTSLDVSEIGARIQLTTPIATFFELFYGVDFSLEDSESPFLFLDSDAFAEENIGAIIATPDQFPSLSQRNIGVFVQARWEITDDLLFNGGVRYEAIQVEVDDFTANPFVNPFAELAIDGATLNTDDVVFNAGLVYQPIETLSIFANFSQGFNVPEFGAFLGLTTDPDFDLEELDFIAQRVDNFELGFNVDLGDFQFGLAGFFNDSELGLAFTVDPETGIAQPTVAPQRNFGFEATIDWQPVRKWSFSAAFTFNEGDFDPTDTGEFVPLATVEVQPFSFNMAIENQTLRKWRNRLQLLVVANRERAFNAGVDPVPIEGYMTVDFISSLKIGSGVLNFGVSNLFDTEFIPAALQDNIGLLEDERFGGFGRRISLGYSISF